MREVGTGRTWICYDTTTSGANNNKTVFYIFYNVVQGQSSTGLVEGAGCCFVLLGLLGGAGCCFVLLLCCVVVFIIIILLYDDGC